MSGAPLEKSSAGAHVGSFVLTQLDVYDWGAFGGRHRAEIDLRGTAIIGPTGSGKTTLVDALMTLVTANPKYNLASTGGHESDRDLMSYVRGVSGAGNNSGDNEHIARSGSVLTGLAACFSDGASTLRIGALFWVEGSSSAIVDLKRRWVFCLDQHPDLDVWLQAQRTGGARGLKQLENDSPGLKFYEDKKGYLARIRSFFGVGENAFSLLNRAAGLKQLNSIDEVFRELVLDDTSKFARATEVADEFNTLDGIHAELETARRQRDALLPIERDWKARSQQLEQLTEQQRLLGVIPRWFGSQAQHLLEQRRDLLQQEIDEQMRVSMAQEHQISTDDEQVQLLQSVYLKAGGAAIEQLRGRCTSLGDEIARRMRPARTYQAWMAALQWDTTLDAAAFDQNQARAVERLTERVATQEERQQGTWALGAQQSRDQEVVDDLARTLAAVESAPGSNLPPEFGRFRAELARHLGRDSTALPFVAELVEVKRDEALRWRGAIERAIGQHRMRLLCDEADIGRALAWVNQRDNKLDVRLLEAGTQVAPAQFLNDGFTRKLNFKTHPLREALKQLLAGVDRHCVDTAEQAREQPPSLTDQGLMSSRRGYFDKFDSRPLNANWMTGFDNLDRIADLQRELKQARAVLEASTTAAKSAQREADAVRAEVQMLQAIEQLQFVEIDVPGAQRDFGALEAQLLALMKQGTDAEAARSRWDNARHALVELRRLHQEHAIRLGVLREQYRQANHAGERAARQAGTPFDDQLRRWAAGHLRALAPEQLDQWDEVAREATKACQESITERQERLRKMELQLVRQMGAAKVVDTGALSEVGSDVQDAPHYLDRLRVLNEEALPEKQRRFVTYLTQSSDQGVTQLLSDIENEVLAIEERIADLNKTLRRVDFQPDHFLQLEPRRVIHESLRTLDQAVRALRSAALKEDQGESHYRSLQHMVALLREAVEKRKTLSARALLDPRHRLQFAVSVIQRAGEVVVETRTSSQGGSGGEKEIIASYVLTASLSYALCPANSSRPTFATIVLDEAFSKSSHAVAGRIIRALEEFGLHPLFVTPNKELRLLRMHTRSAILIHRKGPQATMTSLSWEALEAHAIQRAVDAHEVAH